MNTMKIRAQKVCSKGLFILYTYTQLYNVIHVYCILCSEISILDASWAWKTNNNVHSEYEWEKQKENEKIEKKIASKNTLHPPTNTQILYWTPVFIQMILI